MAARLYRNFAEKEIMPVRQQIDDDEDRRLTRKIFQAMTGVGHQRRLFLDVQ